MVASIALASGCTTSLPDLDGAFFAWDDRYVHCAAEIDDASGIELPDIEAALDRARDRGEVLELLVHTPGVTVGMDRLEAVLAAVHERDLPFLTATELANGHGGAGVALMYDDWHTEQWCASEDLLARYGARVTLYVGRYPTMSPEAHAQLQELAAAGHDVESHSISHQRGPGYVEKHGLTAYVDDEVLASIDLLQASGFDVVSYAYPFGTRTDEIDRAILATGRVRFVRALAKTNELRADPCPR